LSSEYKTIVPPPMIGGQITALVVPFPVARRRPLVLSIARSALDRSPELGELHIQHQLRLQATVMRRRGIDPNLINVEISKLEAAVRALMWDAVLLPQGGR
jgi:hypothetical protein